MAGYSFLEISQGKPEQDRAEQAARIEQMQQGIEQKDIDLRRQHGEEEAGLTQKEITRKGLAADYENTEQQYKNAVQGETQGIMTNQLHDLTVDSKLKQSANIWRAYQAGHKDLALKWLSESALVSPGQQFSDMRVEDSPDEKGPDGKPVRVLTMIPKGEGAKPITVPVSILDNLEKQFGATYKVVDKSLVRVDRQGQVSPVYEPDQFAPNAETGVPFSKRTGQPAAAYGVRPQLAPSPRAPAAIMGTGMIAPVSKLILPGDTPQQDQPDPSAPELQPGVQPSASGMAPMQPAARQQLPAYPLTRRQETHQDARVKQLDSEIRFYLTGSNSMALMMPETQDRYNKLMSIGGALVRAGKNPEEARNAAIDQLDRAEKLQRGGSSGAQPYTGPTPWRQ